MARRRPLYVNEAAQRFRAAIRPSLVGNIAKVEPIMSARMGAELFDWLLDTVRLAIRTSGINSRKGQLSAQLLSGVHVVGRMSLRTLTGRVDAYPWVFPHEFGANIQPKEGQYLTIPIFYGLRPDGSPKYRTPGSWRRWGSFVYTNKISGKKFIAYKSKEGGDLRILYVLVEENEIPARLGLNRIARARLDDLMAAWMMIYVQEAARAGITDLWRSPL